MNLPSLYYKFYNESVVYKYMTYGNLFNFYSRTVKDNASGITFVADGEAGTVTVNGTHTGSSEVVFWINFMGSTLGSVKNLLTFPFDVIVSGDPENASTSTYFLGGRNLGRTASEKYVTAGTTICPAIAVEPNAVCNNVVFRPVIRPAFESLSDNFSPYTMSNRELANRVNDIGVKLYLDQLYAPNNAGVNSKYNTALNVFQCNGMGHKLQIIFSFKETPDSSIQQNIQMLMFSRSGLYTISAFSAGSGIFRLAKIKLLFSSTQKYESIDPTTGCYRPIPDEDDNKSYNIVIDDSVEPNKLIIQDRWYEDPERFTGFSYDTISILYFTYRPMNVEAIYPPDEP